MKQEKLDTILATARDAIRDDDYQGLYQVIAKVTDGVSSVARSSDAFISELNRQPNKFFLLPLGNKR